MMRRRIAFYVSRNNHLKIIAPVVDYILRHAATAFEIQVWLPGWRISKPQLQPDPNDIIALFGDAVSLFIIHDKMDFRTLIKTHSPDVVLTICPLLAEIEYSDAEHIILDARKRGVKWVALPHTFEAELYIINKPESVLKLWDKVCVIGPGSLDFVDLSLRARSSELARVIKDRLVVTGYPEFDGIDEMDDYEIRAKYGLPSTKPIVFISTAPTFYLGLTRAMSVRGLELRFRNSHSLSTIDFAGRLASYRFPIIVPYYRYLAALREFAVVNDACLVAKTRDKHDDPTYLCDYVDYIFSDVTYFPFTTLELLKVSRLYFGFISASAIESILMGVYSITALFLPRDAVWINNNRKAYRNFYYTNRGSIWNTDGVSHLIFGNKLSAYGALMRLSGSSLDDYKVQEEKRLQLLDKFVGFRGKSSERIVDMLSSLWRA